jgi:NTE family protein
MTGSRFLQWLVCGAWLWASGVNTLSAQTAPGASLPHRPRVGLVLSGGGARGLSHVGVLKVLERERIPVDVIAGTSMGAIVGGLYASGMTAQEVETEVKALDWDNVFASRVERREIPQRRKEQDFEVSPLIEVGLGAKGLIAPLGAVSSRGLEAHLRRLTLSTRQVADFDQLPTPFRAVATDMETGQPVILQRGDLAMALRSSMSVPGVFAPVEVEGRILGDGGLVNNTPVDVARAMGAQRLIVVNIGTPLSSRDTLSSLTGVTAQMINILTEQNVQRSLATLTPRDVLIAPTLEGLTSADFNRASEFMNQGELQAEALVLRMQDLKVSEAEYAAWKAARVARGNPNTPLQYVKFEGSRQTHPQEQAGTLETHAGDQFDVARAERDLRRLAATGDYLSTDYRLERTPDGEGLVFKLEDKPWGPDYLQMGLDFSSDTQGRSTFNLKLAHNRHWLDDNGSEWRNFVRLGSKPALNTEWYRPVGWALPDGLHGFVAASAGVQRRTTDLYADPTAEPAVSLARRERRLGLDMGVMWRELGELRLGWQDQVGHDDPDLVTAAWTGPGGSQRWHEQGWRWRAVFDQLDSAYFPSQGWRLDATYLRGKRWGQGLAAAEQGDMSRWDIQGQAVTHWGAHNFEVGGRVAGATGALPALPRYGLGGFQQLSGYAPDQLSGQQVALMRLGYSLRLGSAPLTRGLFVGASAEWGRAWERWASPGQARWHSGSSLYLGADTALGPVYAAIGSADGVRPTVMLFVGRP